MAHAKVVHLGKSTWVVTPPQKPRRPWKVLTMNDEHWHFPSSIEDGIGSTIGNSEENNLSGNSNWPTNNTYWFQLELWPEFEVGLKLHCFKFWVVVRHLKLVYVMQNCKSMLHGLNKSTLHGWFEVDGHTLKAQPLEVLVSLKDGGLWTSRIPIKRVCGMAIMKLIWTLKERKIGVGLNSSLPAFRMKNFLLSCGHNVCIEHGGTFKVSQSYIESLVHEHHSWTFQKPTSNASKLPTNWETREELFTFRLAWLLYG